MKQKESCRILPTEVNHTNYASIIGEKHGADAARAVNNRLETPTREQALAEFKKFRNQKENSRSYKKLVQDMEEERGVRIFWDGAKKGFMQKIHSEEVEEEWVQKVVADV